jgi:cell division topological specificity factor
MAFFDYFRRQPKSASLAKDRLSVIVARERVGTRIGPDYLSLLQQDLLAVLAKYERIDLQQVSVNLDHTGDCDVLELNVFLPVTPHVPVTGAKPATRSLRA